MGSVFSDKIYGSWREIQREKYEKLWHELMLLGLNIKNGLALDVGIGRGYFEEFLIDKNDKNKIKIIGVDKSRDMLEKCSALLNRLVQADGDNLPFMDEVFDCVVCFDTVHLLKSVDEMKRVLKCSGFLLISEPYLEQRRDMINNIISASGLSLIKEFVLEGREKELVVVCKKLV